MSRCVQRGTYPAGPRSREALHFRKIFYSFIPALFLIFSEILCQRASFLSRRTSGLPILGAATACPARTAAQSSGPTHCPSTPPLRPSSCSHRVSKPDPLPVTCIGGVRLRPAAGDLLGMPLSGSDSGPWGTSPSLSRWLGHWARVCQGLSPHF